MRYPAYEHIRTFWLLKTEPSDYSFEQLEHDVSTVWDGVGNNTALMHMREVREGDMAFIYHTGNERSIVGVAKVRSDPYPDPEGDDPRRVVFDVEFDHRLPEPVPLADLRDVPEMADWDLLTNGRLSVMPVPPEHWERILERAGEEPE